MSEPLHTLTVHVYADGEFSFNGRYMDHIERDKLVLLREWGKWLIAAHDRCMQRRGMPTEEGET